MITITQFSGPLDGQSGQFNNANARIEFGRDATSDVADLEYEKAAVTRQFALGGEQAPELQPQITPSLACVLPKTRCVASA